MFWSLSQVTDSYEPNNFTSPYLTRAFQTVGQACRTGGRDRAGTQCGDCNVFDLCCRMETEGPTAH